MRSIMEGGPVRDEIHDVGWTGDNEIHHEGWTGDEIRH